ncbi:hypothetical protein FHS51_003637 [Sphingobium wenxiniae]|jgi:hypothetical protein|uniref:Antitoxin Xre/MbcA/ParS-like toxin-binding domain-containing protein n=2 Tax=Sphingomonadales TaxID=204457 RepID=A0A562K3V7_SPHWJ|nr:MULTISPECIES: hypothetical protein [Sphingomonadaceae]KKC25736.1 hypothetical protein WP12_12490 [Sphingomonas sp. SRS2]MBB6193381.1 hypothetical protein [Sphingobium wenxiniae]OHT17801.1 hypothetical protein BHE75_04599 [Sphingomonas haloaromaticamans]TWH90107.1 hypothetical protein IQ35_03702 [Sphingobium wenxiniae]
MSRPKSAHDLSGLMKYLGRAPWDEMMDEMLVAHLGPACDAMDLEPDDIFDIIGDHWEAQLWGCAFEDLLTQELEPEGLNLVDEYLKRRGWNEKAPNKAYMRALRDTVMSLYEVSEVVPGQSMTLRDLLRDIAPVTVREHSATQTLVNWDKIAARVIEVNGRHGISGALLPFSPDGAGRVIEAFSQLEDDGPGTDRLSPPEREGLLKASGPIFTNIWLLDCLGKAMSGSVPEMVNADGDDLVFHRIVFPLAKGVIGKSVVRRLNAAQWLEPASDTFWNWLAPVTKNRKPRTTKGGQAFVTTMEDGTPVFANVELVGRKLIVEVNSAARAEQAITHMREWLGDCVSTPMTEIRTMAQFMADDAARAPQEEPLDIPSDERERIVHEMLTREYTKTLDEAVPALGNKTPRALARTKAGRAKVADWLKYIENGAAKSGTGEPMATYDFTWMWQELGLIDFRR